VQGFSACQPGLSASQGSSVVGLSRYRKLAHLHMLRLSPESLEDTPEVDYKRAVSTVSLPTAPITPPIKHAVSTCAPLSYLP
jgi:hypothetical protein